MKGQAEVAWHNTRNSNKEKCMNVSDVWVLGICTIIASVVGALINARALNQKRADHDDRPES